jgi:hypothetical protein
MTRTPRTLVRLGLALCVLAVVACAWLRPMDARARDQVDNGLTRAFITYGTARLLHGAVSVVQGTLINAEPAGIGATFAPGQLLAPAAEMLKQFSDVMLLVCVAFGVEKLLIGISAFSAISAALTAVAIAWVGCLLLDRRPPPWLGRPLLLLMMVHFAVPLTVLGSGALFDHFLLPQYTLSQKVIKSTATSNKVEAPAVSVEDSSQGTLEKVRGWWKKKTDVVVTQYDAMKQAAETAVEHAITLMCVFILQTMILPLLLLWGLYAFTRAVLGLSQAGARAGSPRARA